MHDQRKPNKRNNLEPLERAVSDTLDEYLARMHGIFSSWAGPEDFLFFLGEHGYKVVSKELNNENR